MNNFRLSLLKTLSYSDQFGYPLTEYQLWRYCITEHPISYKDFRKKLLKEKKWFGNKGRYYFLHQRGELLLKRKKRLRESVSKIAEAKKIAKLLSFIPTIQYIGISGSLSLKNAEREDDIDFFFITAPHTLWLSRFFVTAILFVLRKKRSRNSVKGMNTICANMYISQENLVIQNSNVYTAHEIAQLRTLINKNNCFEAFMASNSWIRTYLANISIQKRTLSTPHTPRVIRMVDHSMFLFQKFYMKSNITSETVEYEIACFHPQDKTNSILSNYINCYINYLLYLDKSMSSSFSLKKGSQTSLPIRFKI